MRRVPGSNPGVSICAVALREPQRHDVYNDDAQTIVTDECHVSVGVVVLPIHLSKSAFDGNM